MEYTADLDKKRKRFFFKLCASITIAAFMVLSVVDYIERDFSENIIDMAVISIMIAGLIFIRKCVVDVAVYRITHFLICLAFFFSVYSGSGEETVLYWIFIMPLLFFYFFGKGEGLIWTVFFSSGLCLIMLLPWLFEGHSYGHVTISRFFITFLIIIIIGYGLESSRYTFSRLLEEKNQALLREKQQLEEALASIQTLRGLLPICASCKRIRDDQGYWNQLETYLSRHSDLTFSHGICPECRQKLYPDL